MPDYPRGSSLQMEAPPLCRCSMIGVRLSAGELPFAVSAAASGKVTGAGGVNQGAVRRATTMVRIDGSRFSGSGTIVRQAVALSALTGRSVHITNIRFRRPNPGLRPQHARAVEAIAGVVGATIDGNTVGSGQLTFEPGTAVPAQTSVWDIGSSGSTVLLAQAVLPVLAFAGTPSVVELRGGLFQDFAPSFYHFRYVLLPLLRLMGIQAEAQMVRPGYVPGGGGILRLAVQPAGRVRRAAPRRPSAATLRSICSKTCAQARRWTGTRRTRSSSSPPWPPARAASASPALRNTWRRAPGWRGSSWVRMSRSTIGAW